MSTAQTMTRAAAPLHGLVATLTDDDLTRPTPCTGYDIAGLVAHLLFWAPALAGAGTRRPAPPAAAAEADLLPLAPGWPEALRASVDEVAAAWSGPGAWEGSAEFAGAEMPAAVLGGMALGELVVHGWDLAAALGVDIAWDDEVLAGLHAMVAATAAQGREMGAYGPEVPVAETAPLLDRILGLTGRSPAWQPAVV